MEILSFAIIWMNPEDIRLTKASRYRRTNAVSSHLHVESEKVKLTKTESIMVATRRWVGNMGRCWPKETNFQASLLLSRSVMSDSLRPHGLQYRRLPCPSPAPGAYSTHAHRVGDAIQPSHPLSSPPPTYNLSQHQGLFRGVCSLHQVAKVLELQHNQSFQ